MTSFTAKIDSCIISSLEKVREKKRKVHSNLDLGVVSVNREMTPKSRETLNQGFSNNDKKRFWRLFYQNAMLVFEFYLQ